MRAGIVTPRGPFQHADKDARIRRAMKAYMCVICGFVYEEARGRPEDGIAPGTPWESVPETWTCPDCGASKAEFEMIQV